ncbi:MAG: glutamate-5-semialdehyde dehydrogenase [Nitrospirae bacterium]|nr:MAG: glutamate-5-semialdehyde dehydrogenase [Nitrospirota bacterium]
MEINEYVKERAMDARKGARALLRVTSEKKNGILLRMAEEILNNRQALKQANALDIDYARKKGLSNALIDRLTLTDKRIDEMAQGLREVAALPDPVGEVVKMWQRPNGMTVGRMRVPIGVIGIIYESRPNVTVEATSLCMKAGNAVLLRGGSEAVNSNRSIVEILKGVLKDEGMPEGVVSFIDKTDREAVMEMLKLEGLIDLIIPRGGEGLIRTVTENSRIPVLKHYKGVCHVFVDRDADLKMAEEICFNAKVQRPGTCNAMETMLVDEPIAGEFLPVICKRLQDAGVRIKGCGRTRQIVAGLEEAGEDDFYNEYLDLILNVKVVQGIDEAMDHIARYSSFHTESIVTENYHRAMRFLREVDSASVMVNASTRLHDGGQFGLGAEIGISTDKIHARGSMGLEELTCMKFIVLGTGQIRQ